MLPTVWGRLTRSRENVHRWFSMMDEVGCLLSRPELIITWMISTAPPGASIHFGQSSCATCGEGAKSKQNSLETQRSTHERRLQNPNPVPVPGHRVSRHGHSHHHNPIHSLTDTPEPRCLASRRTGEAGAGLDLARSSSLPSSLQPSESVLDSCTASLTRVTSPVLTACWQIASCRWCDWESRTCPGP